MSRAGGGGEELTNREVIAGLFYEFCALIDELIHLLPGGYEDADCWRFRFCQWAHRKDCD